jgi:hypothetical protein
MDVALTDQRMEIQLDNLHYIYWIPAFAGMTSLLFLLSLPSIDGSHGPPWEARSLPLGYPYLCTFPYAFPRRAWERDKGFTLRTCHPALFL